MSITSGTACCSLIATPAPLAQQMQRLADDPRLAERLGRRGYVQSDDGNVPDMMEHSLAVESIYHSLISRSERL